MGQLRISRGRNEILVGSDGREYIDFITGFGAVLLGHGNPAILDRVRRQLDDVWLTGRLCTPIVQEAAERIVAGLEKPYRLLQFCSSGNEALEFVARVATTRTGRKALLGFSRSMHGKSIVAASLGWENDFVDLRKVHTLPFVDSHGEADILGQLSDRLASREVAAVCLELIQGTNGAHEASAEFYRTVASLCREHGTLCVVDEVLTGFYRSGALSYGQTIGLEPDLVIFGKAISNGFPIAAVVARAGIEVTRAMLPGSTFSDNPLAASAVAATLNEMQRLDMDGLTAQLENAVRSELGELGEADIALRGRGALWVLEFPSPAAARAVQDRALADQLLLSANGRFVRLFPPATISREHLHRALGIVREACRAADGA